MSSSRKDERDPMKDLECEQKELISAFAEILTENIFSYDSHEHDDFENYAHQLRAQLHTNKDQFKERFENGYSVLLRELNNSQ